MKFVVSTKPLKNALSLGIIKSNISKINPRSEYIQLEGSESQLKINVEASSIKTEILLPGSGTISGEEDITGIIVDCTMFKGLVDSIDSDIVTIDFNPGNITLTAGTSKFAIPQLLDIDEIRLSEPMSEYTPDSELTLNPEDWKYISDHQTFALANQEKSNFPIYKNVWVSDNQDVITGNAEDSLFTHSKHGNFGGTCLLPLSLINLFTAIPEGSKIIKVGADYILKITTDAYSITTEFTPKYEDNPNVGSYSADMVFEILDHPEVFFTISIAPILKFINQISLLSEGSFDQYITLSLANGILTLSNKSNEYTTSVDCSDSYTIDFDTEVIKSVLSNFDSDTVHIGKMIRGDGEIFGCNIWSDTLTALVSSRG
jgi:hypothetical protein